MFYYLSSFLSRGLGHKSHSRSLYSALSSVLSSALMATAIFTCSLSTQALANQAYATQAQENQVSTTETASVDIRVAHSLTATQQLQLHYPNSVRISQVLADTHANLNTLRGLQHGNSHAQVAPNATTALLYWPGSALFTQQPDTEIAQLKQSVLQQLTLLKNDNRDNAERDALDTLMAWVANLPVQRRLITALDYDAIRINPALNPLLNQNLLLVIPTRPTHVTVVGAVIVPKALSAPANTAIQSHVKWQNRISAKHYLDIFAPFDDADNSVAWVIQPDGHIEQHPFAYWNNETKDIAPGAIIYLPFTSLPDGAETMNTDMVNLLRNSAL